ncbi:protein HYPER-SENSITIVITY-RELATED 4-like [Lycium ferocissimum]|uniref:protein HYPER-SENSITIVITY-RELATED 4-like n=1 Tax=Lycium ferocissimum TaxID=112874 RepID=UPI0028160C20|nr:protein HYPER-SENSITIVITY-RELATED 4-like [Lycium ferocissimum]
MFSLSRMPSTTAVLSAYTTVTASAVLIRILLYEVQNMTNQLLPRNLQEKFFSKIGYFVGNLSSQMCLIIEENNGLILNEVFEASKLYLGTIQISPSTQRLKIAKAEKEKKFSISINKDEKILDTFEGIQLIWELKIVETQRTTFDYEGGGFSSENMERKSFELSFNKEYKEMVLNSYLPFILERSKAIKEENKMAMLQFIFLLLYDLHKW